MLFLLSLAIATNLPSVNAFSLIRSRTAKSAIPNFQRSVVWKLSSEASEDWYSDFDPNEDYAGGRYNVDSQPRYRQQRFAPRDQKYTRDTSRDNSNIDVTAVEELVTERVNARSQQDYDRADQIRQILMDQYGVSVWDKDRTWRSGCSRSGSGMKRGGGGRQRRARDFGPTGHDYTQSLESGGEILSSLTLKEIDDLIAERLNYKMSRQFTEADRIQQILLGQGVYVHDGLKEWRADGITFGDVGGSGGKPGKQRRNAYVESDYSEKGNMDEETTLHISELVNQRSGAKQVRNYALADEIREKIKADYNVFIDDRLQEWSVNNNFGPDHVALDPERPYRQAPDSDRLESDESYREVEAMVAERKKLKQNRDYRAADQLRDELWELYGVSVNDKVREWTVGGDRHRRKSSSKPRGFAAVGHNDLTAEENDEIAELVVEREIARKKKNFQLADQIRDELYERFSVLLDDRGRTWYIEGGSYSLEGALPATWAEDVIEFVKSQIDERSLAKGEGLYESADRIRDLLQRDYGVSLDDRARVWTVNVAKSKEGITYEPELASEELRISKVATGGDSGSKDAPTTAMGSSEEDEFEDLSELTVVQLKEKLRAAGLRLSGKKAELIERLVGNDVR